MCIIEYLLLSTKLCALVFIVGCLGCLAAPIIDLHNIIYYFCSKMLLLLLYVVAFQERFNIYKLLFIFDLFNPDLPWYLILGIIDNN